MTMINISICLSDIPAEARTKSSKNGKIYANFCVAERKEADQFGNTHTVFISQSKEEREAKKDKTYVGSGKAVTFTEQKPQGNQFAPPFNDEEDDLPF